MKFPFFLQEEIERQLSQLPLPELVKGSQQLSHSYRERHGEACYMKTLSQRLAYLAVRMPATFVVIEKILLEVRSRLPDFTCGSLLDVGAGPGTATWAVKELFGAIEKVTLLEKDSALIELGKKMGEAGTWVNIDVSKPFSMEPHDLVVMSYAIGEMAEKAWEPLFKTLWDATNKILIVIEPGTPQGFERVRRIRELFIGWGAHILAPCPHAGACPMKGGDWCHFPARVERSFFHKYLKGAELGYEDEKFSYLVLSKTAHPAGANKILRSPLKRSGHVEFALCTPEGLKRQVVSRKEKENYHRAKKMEWGDDLNTE